MYSSDLERAARTGEIIAAACGVPLAPDEGLRERNMGIFQGLTATEVRERYPEEHAAYERIGFEYVIPDGESARQRLERSVRVLTTIAKRHMESRVAVVTHGGLLMGFFEYVLGMHPGSGWRFRRLSQHYASFNAFEYIGGRWTLETWNDVTHLGDLSEFNEAELAQPKPEPDSGSTGNNRGDS